MSIAHVLNSSMLLSIFLYLSYKGLIFLSNFLAYQDSLVNMHEVIIVHTSCRLVPSSKEHGTGVYPMRPNLLNMPVCATNPNTQFSHPLTLLYLQSRWLVGTCCTL